jgi:hypothetical protein
MHGHGNFGKQRLLWSVGTDTAGILAARAVGIDSVSEWRLAGAALGLDQPSSSGHERLC